MKREKIRKFFSSISGQDLFEYALILCLVSIASVTCLTSLGTAISGVFCNAASTLAGCPAPT
jgi:Flp pilus assembly pilin Flp